MHLSVHAAALSFKEGEGGGREVKRRGGMRKAVPKITFLLPDAASTQTATEIDETLTSREFCRWTRPQ